MKIYIVLMLLSILMFSCTDQDVIPIDSCTTDPEISVAENIIGGWNIANDGEVTFFNDSTGVASDEGRFGKMISDSLIKNFKWGESAIDDLDLELTWVLQDSIDPFEVITMSYTMQINKCDSIILQDQSGEMSVLTR